MANYVAKYREGDSPYGEEVLISIEGTECGFIGTPDTGEELDLFPADSMEEARADLEDYFVGWDTFEWID